MKCSEESVESVLDRLKEGLKTLILSEWDEARRAHGRNYNQNAIAEDLGFKQSELSDYLRCKRVPTLQKLIGLALIRNVTLEALLSELLGRSPSGVPPIEEQVRSLDFPGQIKLMAFLAQLVSGDEVPKVPRVEVRAIETMTFAETVVVLDAVVLRQRSLLSEKV